MPVLSVLGGTAGVEVIEGILSLPRQTAGGKPAYPGLFDKAAALFRSLTLDHPFVDGNKRMAVASTLAFLSLNDWIVAASDDELIDLALSVASGNVTERIDLKEWFEARSLPYEQVLDAWSRGTIPDMVANLPGGRRVRRPLLEILVKELGRRR